MVVGGAERGVSAAHVNSDTSQYTDLPANSFCASLPDDTRLSKLVCKISVVRK